MMTPEIFLIDYRAGLILGLLLGSAAILFIAYCIGLAAADNFYEAKKYDRS
jgi:hypothetical protein